VAHGRHDGAKIGGKELQLECQSRRGAVRLSHGLVVGKHDVGDAGRDELVIPWALWANGVADGTRCRILGDTGGRVTDRVRV
jgi:hypothetical protein